MSKKDKPKIRSKVTSMQLAAMSKCATQAYNDIHRKAIANWDKDHPAPSYAEIVEWEKTHISPRKRWETSQPSWDEENAWKKNNPHPQDAQYFARATAIERSKVCAGVFWDRYLDLQLKATMNMYSPQEFLAKVQELAKEFGVEL